MIDPIQSPEQDVVLFSRVRISRNFAEIPFAPKLTKEISEAVIERTREAIFQMPRGKAFSLKRLADMDQDDRVRLAEHGFISRRLLDNVSQAAAFLTANGRATVMCNEEDHLRFQGLLPGMRMEKAAQIAFELEETVAENHPFVFDSQWGYLTANPTKVGTGMRASVILHLPALAQAEQIKSAAENAEKQGMQLSSLNAEGTEVQGALYLLSNIATLGRSEEDILDALVSAAEQLIDLERDAREESEQKDALALKDKLMRSFGQMMFAQMLSVNDFMQFYSDARYAVSLGYLSIPLSVLDGLMMDMQPASIVVRAGKAIGEREAEILRAEFVREALMQFEENS